MHPQNIDLDTITSTEAGTHKVDVAYDGDGNATSGFVIVSKDSPQYRTKAQSLRVSGIRRGATKSQRIDTKTDEGAQELDRLLQANELELAIAVTVGWFGFQKNGVPAEFSADKVRELYTARPTWREKVTAALENEANFLPSSLATSSTSPGTSSA